MGLRLQFSEVTRMYCKHTVLEVLEAQATPAPLGTHQPGPGQPGGGRRLCLCSFSHLGC